MPQICKFEPHQLWKKANKEAIAEKAREISTFPRNFTSIADIDSSVGFLISWMKEVIDQHVPMSKPAPFCVPRWSEEIKELVVEARRAFRRHRRNPSELAWQEYLEANKAKGAAISRAKRRCFEEAIEKACKEGGKSIWRLAKWAKSKSFLPPALPSMPTLTTPQGPATTPEAKCEALKARFFPPIPAADLSDIPDFQYPAEKFLSTTISIEEIASALCKARPHKAPGPDDIPIFFLKLLGRPLLEYLQPLFQACLHLSYHPIHFKQSSTAVLRKPGKGDYSAPAAWRPIALLNTLGKVLEAVVASRITALSEEHGLLPPQQMGARPGRSTDTALDMLLQQIHAAWQKDNGVVSLLSLDMSGAYDRVVPSRLLHNLRKRCLPQWIVNFISSFLTDRSTSLCLPGFSSSPFSTYSGIPQGSPLSPILFLFYNADLVDLCNSLDLPITCIGFVDDVNNLAFGLSTEETCTALKEIHSRCLRWGEMHGASFCPRKVCFGPFPQEKEAHPHHPPSSAHHHPSSKPPCSRSGPHS